MSTTCRYCLKQFTRSDNRKRHEANHLQVEQRDSNEQGHSENNIFEPITPEPPSPTETTEPETGEPADLGSPTVHVDPKTGKKFVFDIFGDPMSPNTLTPLDEFPESSASPVKQEEEISDIDPWDEFRERVKVIKLKDFRHLVNSLQKAGLSKKRARIRNVQRDVA